MSSPEVTIHRDLERRGQTQPCWPSIDAMGFRPAAEWQEWTLKRRLTRPNTPGVGAPALLAGSGRTKGTQEALVTGAPAAPGS